MSINLNISHGDTKIPITDIGLGQGIKLLTEDKLVNDNINLTLTGVQYYNGQIKPGSVEIPYTGDYVYTGSTIYPTWQNYDATLMTKSGDEYGLNAGTYNTIFTLIDPDAVWSDDTSGPKTITWYITQKTVDLPTAEKKLYTGSPILPDWIGFNAYIMSKLDETAQTNIGKYSTTFRIINSNYKWSNTSEIDQVAYWKISEFKVEYQGTKTWELNPAITNPDPTVYEGVYQSNNPFNLDRQGIVQTWVLKINIINCTSFKLYIRSWADTNDYSMASKLDGTIPTNYRTAYAHTAGYQREGTDLNNYVEVSYNNITTDAHYIYVVYRRNSTGTARNADKGYLLIKGGVYAQD